MKQKIQRMKKMNKIFDKNIQAMNKQSQSKYKSTHVRFEAPVFM